LVLLHQHKWFGLQGELDQERMNYRKNHQHLMRSGFGRGYYFEMNRFELNKGKYLMIKLEVLEERLAEKEERFNELHRYLGRQYCYDLEPSVVGFKRCVAHLFLEQTRTYLIVAIIFFFDERIFQLMSIFVIQNVYFGIQLTWV